MSKRGDDYIPYSFEIERERAAAAERAKTSVNPKHVYSLTYDIKGHTFSEKVVAYNAVDAEETLRQQLSMVGMFPQNIRGVKFVDDSAKA